MASLDIFNNDAFSVTSLTNAVNDLPHMPGRIGELGLFSEDGITSTTFMIESQGTTINLVPSAARGAPGDPVQGDKRKLIPFSTVHLPQRANILADEVQNVRAFGSESEIETVQNLVNKRLAKMRRNLDVTIEYQRMGAIKGQILDADGGTLLDLFTTFNVTQQSKSLVLGTATTDVKRKLIEAKRLIEDALGGLMYRDLRVLCSPGFFDTLVGHAKVEGAYDRWMNGEFLRTDQRDGGFYFAGVYFEEYRGKVGSTDFIADGEAYMIPGGAPDLFVTNFAPADYMETVNTIGLPYYAKQEMLRMNKGVELESQSNPISICTRPRAVIKLLAA